MKETKEIFQNYWLGLPRENDNILCIYNHHILFTLNTSVCFDIERL
jgi:hypothetical protein